MRKRMKLRLNVKIVLIILVLTVVISTFTCMVLFRYFSAMTTEQLKLDNQVRFDQIVRELDAAYEEAVRYGQQISTDPLVQSILSEKQPSSTLEEIKENTELANNLQRLAMLSQFVDSIALVKNDEVVVWTEVPFWDAPSHALRQEWYQTFVTEACLTDTGRQTVGAPYIFSYTGLRGERRLNLISIYFPVYSISRPSYHSGGLVVNITLESINQVLQMGSEGFDALAYFNGNNELIYATEQANASVLRQVAQGALSAKSDNFPVYFRGETLLNGTLVSMLDYVSPFHASSWVPLHRFVLVLLLAVALAVLLLIPFMLRLTRPVTVLAHAIQQMSEGDLNVRADVRSGDEFEFLGNELNLMVQRLSDYIDATIQYERDKHDLEYEVLVAQINPHFIYNTLNTVIYFAKKGRSEDVIAITKALIDLLQDGIKLSDDSKKRNFSSVEEELWIIQSYVVIQHYRYSERFELIVDCPELLRKKQIPTSVIQPLIENALFHGIVPLTRFGTIRLELSELVSNDVSYLSICISDDGVGIPEEKIQLIMSGGFQLTDVSRNHVGVQNIIKRLSLLYQDRYTMKICSEENKGTQVEILLPEQTEE